jgi:hypothetical protein
MASETRNSSPLSAKERKEARRVGEVSYALTMKALLHRLDPKAFPVGGDASSLEAKAAKMAKTIKPQAFAKLQPLIENKAHQAADFSRVIDSARGLNPSGVALPGVETELPTDAGTKSVFTRLELFIRRMHCVDETDPEGGSDDMVLAGVLIGASGRTNVANTVIKTGFDDGEIKEINRTFGRYSLNTTSVFPKDFLAVFKLVESDSIDEVVAANLESILKTLGQTAELLHTNAPPVQKPGLVAQSVLTSVNLFYGITHFPAKQVHIALTHLVLSHGNESGNLVTPNMKGHGGTYRIGYKWRLASGA